MASSKQPTNEEIASKFQFMRNELQQIATKMTDLQAEKDEHQLVLKALEPVDRNRKCFRLLNGVLVERTVEQALPDLKLNVENLKKVIENFENQFKIKEKDLLEFQKKYQIRVENRSQRKASSSGSEDKNQATAENSTQSNSSGVLV